MRYKVPLRGDVQRKKIMTALENGPMSAQDLAQTIHLTRSGVLVHLKAMRNAGQVRIAGYVMRVRTREIPLYGLGSAPDAEYVRAKYRIENRPFDMQRAKVRNAIVEQLQSGKATAPELAILLGLSNPTMRKYLPKLHSEGLIHRAAWVPRQGGGQQVALWAAGPGIDAPRSALLKNRGPSGLSEDQRDLIRRNREAKKIVRIARQRPQGIFAALGI